MEKAAKFVGSIHHTEDTIQLLYKTQYYTYDTLRVVIRLLIGAAMVVVGFSAVMPRPLQVLLLMGGCWLIVSKDFPAAVQADRVIDARKGALPQNTCTFYDSGMDLDGEGHMRIQYGQFQRLVEDEHYLYLFLGKRSVCMVEKDSVEHGSAQELKEFVEKHTKLKWVKNKSLLQLNLKDLRQAVRDSRQH